MEVKKSVLEEIVAEEDLRDGPFCSYLKVVKVFNEKKNGRYITANKMADIYLKVFPGEIPSKIVIENFIKRSKCRFINPPIKREQIGELMQKTRNISSLEIEFLGMPLIAWERLGSPRI